MAAMTRTPLALVLTLLFAAGCDRNSPPDLIRGAGDPTVATAPPAGVEPTESAPPAVNTPKPARVAKSSPGKLSTRKPSAGAPRTGSGSRRPVDDQDTANDPCAGLDGRALDDCLGFDEGARDDDGGRDFASEQRRRDRALLEREAEEAAERAREAEEAEIGSEEDDNYPPPEDEPPLDDYDPGYDDQYPDEPPPR